MEFGEYKLGKISVKLDGKIVGHIVRLTHGFQYRPKGSTKKQWGEKFYTLDEVKNSLK